MSWLLSDARCRAKIVSRRRIESYCARDEHPRPEIGRLHHLRLAFDALADQLAGEPGEFAPRGPLQQDLPGLEEGDQIRADVDGHRGFPQAGETFERPRPEPGRVLQPTLELQAGGASPAGGRHQRAKRAGVRAVLMGRIEGFDRPQVQRQAGDFLEGALVIAINRRVFQLLDNRATAAGRSVALVDHGVNQKWSAPRSRAMPKTDFGLETPGPLRQNPHSSEQGARRRLGASALTCLRFGLPAAVDG